MNPWLFSMKKQFVIKVEWQLFVTQFSYHFLTDIAGNAASQKQIIPTQPNSLKNKEAKKKLYICAGLNALYMHASTLGVCVCVHACVCVRACVFILLVLAYYEMYLPKV